MAYVAIRTEGLTRRFGTITAVDGVDLEIPEGAIFGLLGPNGSGKTTLMRMLCGLLRPSEGAATVLGYDGVAETEKIKREIGYMSQQFSLYNDLTVMENLTFYARVYSMRRRETKPRIDEVVDLVDIGPYRDRQAGKLSGGWKQRLALACALVHRPRLMYLDEPTAGIDPVARRDLWNLIFRLSGEGVTFFVTTHYMDEAERCSRLGYIYLAKLIVKGAPDALKQMPEVRPQGMERLEVRCERLSEALMFLNGREYVREATIFGDALHVLARSSSMAAIEHELAVAGFESPQIRPIDPSLEDVFVTLTRIRGGNAHVSRN